MLDKLEKLLEERGEKQATAKEHDEWDEEVPAPAPKAADGAGRQPGGMGGLKGGRPA